MLTALWYFCTSISVLVVQSIGLANWVLGGHVITRDISGAKQLRPPPPLYSIVRQASLSGRISDNDSLIQYNKGENQNLANDVRTEQYTFWEAIATTIARWHWHEPPFECKREKTIDQDRKEWGKPKRLHWTGQMELFLSTTSQGPT